MCSIVIEYLAAIGPVAVEHVEDGTNIVLLRVSGQDFDAERLKQAGLAQGLKLPTPIGDVLPVKLNGTWLRLEPADLARRIVAALTE